LRFAVLEKNEIVLGQIGDGVALLVVGVDIHDDQVRVGGERGVLARARQAQIRVAASLLPTVVARKGAVFLLNSDVIRI
jgi:hypothetical protein